MAQKTRKPLLSRRRRRVEFEAERFDDYRRRYYRGQSDGPGGKTARRSGRPRKQPLESSRWWAAMF